MRTFLELFARRGIVFLALMVAVGSVVALKLDERIGMLLAGVIFGLSGVGNWLVAARESHMRGLRRALAVFLMLFGLFTIIVMVIMFIRGDRLGVPPSP